MNFLRLLVTSCLVFQAIGAAESTHRTYDYPATPSMQAAKLTVKATGFFRVEQIDGRWWLIDPLGRADLFIGVNGGAGLRWKDYGPTKYFLDRFGDEAGIRNGVIPIVESLGFNVQCAEGNESYSLVMTDGCKFGQTGRVMPYTSLLGGNDISGRHGPEAEAVNLFPQPYKPGGEENWHQWVADPFHPRFAIDFDLAAQRLCAPNKGNPWLVGYYLDNEKEWQNPLTLLAVTMRRPANQPAKQHLVELAKARFADAAALGAAFGITLTSFEALAERRDLPTPVTAAGMTLIDAWLDDFYDRNIGTLAAIVRKHDPNHLLLGTREMGPVPNKHLFKALGKYCEVISINDYITIDPSSSLVPSELGRLKQLSDQAGGRPVINSEWTVQAKTESTFPFATMTATQVERGPTAAALQRAMMAAPYMLGSMWYLMSDGVSHETGNNFGITRYDLTPFQPLATDLKAVANEASLYHLGRKPSGVQTDRGQRTWKPSLPTTTTQPAAFDETIGGLHYTLTSDRLEVRRGDMQVGFFRPLAQQLLLANRWPIPTTCRVLARREDAAIIVLDLVYARPADAIGGIDAGNGVAPPASERAFSAYEMTWRLWFPKDATGWFASQNLSIDDISGQSWICPRVFPQFHPIGKQPQITIPSRRNGEETFFSDAAAGFALATFAPGEGLRGIGGHWFFPDGNPCVDVQEQLDPLHMTAQRRVPRDGMVAFHAIFPCAADGSVKDTFPAVEAEVRSHTEPRP